MLTQAAYILGWVQLTKLHMSSYTSTLIPRITTQATLTFKMTSHF